MIPITKFVLERIAPRFHNHKHHSQQHIIAEISKTMEATATKQIYGITTLLRKAHFLAQICHESDGFSTLHEYASGKAYEGREDLGNVHAGDGVRYKGRGLIQLTGRTNYRVFGKHLGLPLEANPELASDPAVAVQVACEFWRTKHINHFCDLDDIIHVTRRVNGGLNGLKQREKYLERAKAVLGGTQTHHEPLPAPTWSAYIA